MATAHSNKPAVLIIRDGWGENPHPEHDAFNAIKLAKTPVAHRLSSEYPTTLIHTSGPDVGLPEGTMGNSEVGHQNIGAGRIVDQESWAITKACRAGNLRENSALVSAIRKAADAGRRVHLMGICSDAGVHGQLDHLYAVVELCKQLDARDVSVHLFTDGRDTGPFTGRAYIAQVEARLRQIGVGRIDSLVGRYWAMDRDNRWERVRRAYVCLTGLGGTLSDVIVFPTADSAITDYYENPITETQRGDEFVTPRWIGANAQDCLSRRITDGDTVIFYNYRGDRPREILQALVFPDFPASAAPSPDTGAKGFDRGPRLNVSVVTMTSYWTALKPFVAVAFAKPPKMVNILGEHLANLGLTQFRCAETEKYAHVTFFFNDYREEPFSGEKRELIQSPKVATYDLQPEMSAEGVCQAVLRRIAAADGEDVIIVNFANGDMVGHTGVLAAAIKACETVDACVGRIVDATLERGGCAIVTADHGNAEQMWDPATNAPHTSHTLYDVPLIAVAESLKGRRLRSGGRLADIAPTLLDMMGKPKPAEMSGSSLIAP